MELFKELFVLLPTWAKAVIVVVLLLMLAPGPVVLAFVLGQSSGWVPSVMKDHISADVERDRAVLEFREVAKRHYLEQASLTERLTVGLRVMCENAAKDQRAFNNCLLIR